MLFGYKWVSTYPNDHHDFLIDVKDQKIELAFTGSERRFNISKYSIWYEKKEDSTFVSCSEKEKRIEVEESMIDAFCEDYRMFLINHCTFSYHLELRDNSFKTNTNNRIFECMKTALESRKEKFKVKRILFEMFDQKQVIELLQYINPEILTKVHFHLSNFEELTDYLVNWNRGCRLDVSFQCMDLSTEILTSFKRMFNYPSVFRCIQLHCRKMSDSEKKQYITFFEPYKPKYHWEPFKFELKSPSKVVNLAKQADRLSLQDVRSLEVFANPLLMKIIAEEIDYFDTQNLRKVSRDIRHCIDYVKPDPHIAGYEISISVKPDDSQSKIETKIYHEIIHRSKCKIFRQTENCVVVENHILLKNGKKNIGSYSMGESRFKINKHTICVGAVNQFKIHTMHQKSIMDQFILRSEENVFELTGDVLKSRDTPLRVRKLILNRAKEKDIMNILPYLDSVESIVNNYWEPDPLNLAEVSKLVQWRNALELYFRDCIITNTIEELNLINFQKIDIKLNSISTNDVIYLKENTPEFSKLEKFEIKFEVSLIDDSLYTLLPPFQRVANNKSVWFSPIFNSNEFVHISLHEQNKVIILKRVDRDSVPIELL